MAHQVTQSQLTSALPLGAWNCGPLQGVATNARLPSDSLSRALLDLLRRVAVRSLPLPPGFDPPRMARALRDRVVGLELNLCDPSPEEECCLKAWQPEDWADFQSGAAQDGGQGIAYVEMGADLLPDLLPGLQQLHELECLSVWAPPQGGSLDFGILYGRDDPLRVNILGTPAKPLSITVSDNVKVEGREPCRAIAASRVYRRNDGGELNPDPVPLASSRPPAENWAAMPCVADPILNESLVPLLNAVARTPAFAKDKVDPAAVAQALARCGRFDVSGNFGFDLKNLTATQVRCVQALPAQAWIALRDSVERSGEDVSWLDLHDEFLINDELTRALNYLAPLNILNVPAPAGGGHLSLGKLQGGSAQLQVVRIRYVAANRLTVSVPKGVFVIASKAQASSDAIKHSTVIYQDTRGRVIGKAPLFPVDQLTIRPQ